MSIARRPAPLANLIADNRKVPLTSFEQLLGFGSGPTGAAAARRNLRPIAIPGTRARLGLATSLPAFAYGPVTPTPCADVAVSYMRCLNALGANVVIQADANDGIWAAPAGDGVWQPLEWMGSAYRAVTDRSVSFDYAINPFMVGNLADTPFDGQIGDLAARPPRSRLRVCRRRQRGERRSRRQWTQAPVPGARAVGRRRSAAGGAERRRRVARRRTVTVTATSRRR